MDTSTKQLMNSMDLSVASLAEVATSKQALGSQAFAGDVI